ncbi:MAG TPA: ester cyclase [Thermoanaerobaculia bacterium]|nr:ester cyclase [Thermoanaerobaculia bacterium]
MKLFSLLLFLALFLAIAATAQPVSAPAVAPDPLQANKDLVRRYIEEVLSANRLEKLDELFTADFTDRTPGAQETGTGPEVIRATQTRVRSLFPAVEYQIDDLIAEGDKVVARYTVRAATKAAEGVPSQRVEITGMTLFRIAQGKIRETWIVNDQVELYRQLGYTVQPPG